MSYCPEPGSHSRNKIKIELDLCNYAVKFDVINVTGLNTSRFTKKVNLVSLKSKVDKLDVDELETFLVDLSELIDVLHNDVVKNNTYVELIKKLNTINSDKQNLERKIEHVDKKIPIDNT